MPPKRRLDDDAGASTEELKRHKSAVDEAISEFVCPITQSLPVDPVTAEDGKVYERSAIVEWLERNERSPMTNEPMGKRLQPALSVKNMIRTMVKSGAIAGDKVDAWQAKLKEEETVERWRRSAEAGDGEAMERLGEAYSFGTHDMAKDKARALEWYRRADAAGSARGTNRLGVYIAHGLGGATRSAHAGAVLMGEAAGRGSQDACHHLGRAFADGSWGFPKDEQMARRYYSKVVDAAIDDGLPDALETAAKWLREHPA